MRIPSADEIEIIHAEDDPLPPQVPKPPLKSWQKPDRMPLADLPLSVRIRNCLADFGEWDPNRREWIKIRLETVGDIRRLSDAHLLRLPNFGRKSLNELREACGDDQGTPYVRKQQSLAELLGPERAQLVAGLRSVAGQLIWLADLIVRSGVEGKL